MPACGFMWDRYNTYSGSRKYDEDIILAEVDIYDVCSLVKINAELLVKHSLTAS